MAVTGGTPEHNRGGGFEAALWGSTAFVAVAAALTYGLPSVRGSEDREDAAV